MNRRVLLIEPNYKNKYPPLGLMKLSRYFREICQDDVRFFKGDLKKFAAELLTEQFYTSLPVNIFNFDLDDPKKIFCRYHDALLNFIRVGKYSYIDSIPNLRGTLFEDYLIDLRQQFKQCIYPKFDIICINSLFTFFWKETIDTINYAKNFLSSTGSIYVGGIAATLVTEEMQAEVGQDVKIHRGLLDKPTDLDKSDDVIIDTLSPDYSILEEIDYKYPANDAYFAYTTRGCIRKCDFCAVRTLEPEFKHYVDIREQLAKTESQFGTKQHLLLMDNNVLASSAFEKIIDDIKSCGFDRSSGGGGLLIYRQMNIILQ